MTEPSDVAVGVTDLEEFARGVPGAALPLVVVRRPVETTTALVVPEDAGVSGEIVVEYTNGARRLTATKIAEDWKSVARWCIPGQPWTERTTVQTARAWTAGDVPEGEVVYYSKDGLPYSWDTAKTKRSTILNFANDTNAHALLVLPTLDVSP